jgi:hypothetical protein
MPKNTVLPAFDRPVQWVRGVKSATDFLPIELLRT